MNRRVLPASLKLSRAEKGPPARDGNRVHQRTLAPGRGARRLLWPAPSPPRSARGKNMDGVKRRLRVAVLDRNPFQPARQEVIGGESMSAVGKKSKGAPVPARDAGTHEVRGSGARAGSEQDTTCARTTGIVQGIYRAVRDATGDVRLHPTLASNIEEQARVRDATWVAFIAQRGMRWHYMVGDTGVAKQLHGGLDRPHVANFTWARMGRSRVIVAVHAIGPAATDSLAGEKVPPQGGAGPGLSAHERKQEGAPLTADGRAAMEESLRALRETIADLQKQGHGAQRVDRTRRRRSRSDDGRARHPSAHGSRQFRARGRRTSRS